MLRWVAEGEQEVNVQINVSARHTEVAKRDRDLIIEKLSRLGGKFLEMDRAEVHFFQERNPRIHDKECCEITLEGHGHHIRCKAGGPDHLTAVDRAIEKLENKLHKLKTKLSTHRTHRDVTRAKRASQRPSIGGTAWGVNRSSIAGTPRREKASRSRRARASLWAMG